ncbi:MAG: murein biosynthesis integral membrane protein MurJ [Caulobacterales bacterium]|nr:murein biosynthesis integral membrane protein MurJ [Caulobacterales bacterium]
MTVTAPRSRGPSLVRSTAVIGGLTGVSRILGFAREMLIAAVLGAGPVSDAFFVAFRLPNLFRRILAEGAFNSAFVPLYARRLEGGEEGGPPGETPTEAAERFASETFAALITVLALLVLGFQLAMPFLVIGLAPGYADQPGWIARTTVLGLITMPYILFMSLSAMFGGVLSAHGRFAAFAFAPVLLNVVLVALLLSPIGVEWQAARWLAWGVAVAGLAQCGVVYWGMRRQGVRLNWVKPRLTPGVKKVLTLGLPGALAAGATQINIVVSQQIASAKEGAVSWLSFADRLYQLPLGMIGIAMGVALLPTLSRRLRAGDEDGARQSLNRAIEIASFFTAPAAVALAVSASFWIQAIFEHGRFTAEDTANTTPMLIAFAAGVPAFIAVKVFAPGFFAREDTKTPMRYAIVAVLINMALGVSLFFAIGVTGVAIATSAAGWANTVLLARTLARDGLLRPDVRLLTRFPRILIASAVMGVVLWPITRAATPYLGQGIATDIIVCLGAAGAGLIVYLAAALALGVTGPRELRAMIKRS